MIYIVLKHVIRCNTIILLDALQTFVSDGIDKEMLKLQSLQPGLCRTSPPLQPLRVLEDMLSERQGQL